MAKFALRNELGRYFVAVSRLHFDCCVCLKFVVEQQLSAASVSPSNYVLKSFSFFDLIRNISLFLREFQLKSCC